MTMINTTDDFIRLLRANPEFLAAARRELLTEELLELPQRFSQYAQTTEKRLDSVDRRLSSLEQGQQRLEQKVNGLERGQRRLENNVNTLRGDALETKCPPDSAI